MAEFRSDIYLQQQQPDILGSVERGLKMSDLIQERQAKRQEQEQNNLINEAYARNSKLDPSGKVIVDQGALLSQLSGKVPAKKLMEFQTQLFGQQKQQIEAQSMQSEQLKKMIDNGMPALLAAKQNPNVWPAARQRLLSLGFKETDFPEQYDPAMIDQNILIGQDASKKIEMELAQAKLAQAKIDTVKTRAEIGKIGAETAQIGKVKPEDVFKVATELRKERSGLETTKNTNTIATSYNTIKSIANDATGASDMSLIFSYMKMLDPASTVREGEYASAKDTAGLPQKVVNAYNKAIDGQFLSKEQRQDFLNQAKKKYDVQLSSQKEIDKKFERIAKKSGVDPKDVIFDIESNFDNMSDDELLKAYKDAGGTVGN